MSTYTYTQFFLGKWLPKFMLQTTVTGFGPQVLLVSFNNVGLKNLILPFKCQTGGRSIVAATQTPFYRHVLTRTRASARRGTRPPAGAMS